MTGEAQAAIAILICEHELSIGADPKVVADLVHEVLLTIRRADKLEAILQNEDERRALELL